MSSTEAEKCKKAKRYKSGNDGYHHHDNEDQQGGLGQDQGGLGLDQHLHLADAGEERRDQARLETSLAGLLVGFALISFWICFEFFCFD